MHSRRLICLVLGLWIGGGLLVAWFATDSFHNVDRVMAEPNRAARTQMQALGWEKARMLLRYQVAEENRSLFQLWETTQLFAGGLFFFYLLFGTEEKKFALSLALILIAITATQRFILTPEIINLGRLLDYVPSDEALPERTKFWVLHSAYSGLEVLKWGVAFAFAVKNIWGRKRGSKDAGDEFDQIDKPNHRHVYR